MSRPNSWAGSNRRKRLPPNWSQLREQVRIRANDQCEAALRDGSRCPDQGTDCDHIVAGDNHALTNLQYLCRWHHSRKTAAEGNSPLIALGFPRGIRKKSTQDSTSVITKYRTSPPTLTQTGKVLWITPCTKPRYFHTCARA